MDSPNQANLGQQASAEQAIVYDPSLDKFETVRRENLKSEYCTLAIEKLANFLANSDTFAVHLPWWRNKVDIYVDPKNRSGFVATVQLNRLGPAKNLQRRFRPSYKVLHIKSSKSGIASRASSSSSTSTSVMKDGDHSG